MTGYRRPATRPAGSHTSTGMSWPSAALGMDAATGAGTPDARGGTLDRCAPYPTRATAAATARSAERSTRRVIGTADVRRPAPRFTHPSCFRGRYARAMATPGTNEPIRIAIIGCGDVARRRYLPALATLGPRVDVTALVDRAPDAANGAAAMAQETWPGARPHADIADAAASVDAVVNLTPAPLHAAVTRAALELGLHVYSEKPIAGTLADADELIATARDRGRLLLCAPGEAVSRRGRWLDEIVRSGRLGRLTLAVAHHADSGPATWREYSGDPAVFYGPGVGPVFDHGIYRLHLMTTLLGPVRRVQAMGSISRPTRIVRGGPRTGDSIPITAPDHVLINLEFDDGSLGQLLASFGAANTRAPWLELHFTGATLSYGGASYDAAAPASLFLDDDSPLGLEGWIDGLGPPPPEDGLGTVEAGILHFVACIRGEETPVLTAEHARHVLDIVLRAYESIDDGAAHDTETTMTGRRADA